MKKDYMARLERAARWRLPRQEAEEVIADYRDIVGDPPRPEDELRREVGEPEQVIKLLVSPPKAYRVWQAVFAVLAACILIPGVSPLGPFYGIWNPVFYYGRYGPVLPAIGLIVSLVWFRRTGYKGEQLPRAIPILLAALLAWCGGILLLDWAAMRDPQGFSEAWGEMPSLIGPNLMVSRSVVILNDFLAYGGAALALLGIFGLVRARTQDRRWAAVYILAMAVMLVSLESLAVFTNMDPTFFPWEGWYLPYLNRYAVIAAVGVAGAGVALC